MKIDELRDRIGFTLLILLVVRFGSHIILPGIDPEALTGAFANESNTLFGFFDMFVGGAYSNAAIFALGIMPYITSSIIFQLAGIVVPQIQKIQKEGEEGRRKITAWTRYMTVLISALQGFGIAYKYTGMGVVVGNPALFMGTAVLLLTSGTIFMMWLGEQITEKGIGNGISLIIMINIIARLPIELLNLGKQLFTPNGSMQWPQVVMAAAFMGAIVWAIIVMTQGARRIPVQYAKRQVGNKVYGGQTQYIPLRINTAGVMPIIFAQSLMFLPGTVAGFFPNNGVAMWFAQVFSYTSWFYAFSYALVIVFFTYFYTAIVFSPREIADNMKKQGGFIPGIKPGNHTVEYIDRILTRITLPGSLFLALIAIMPNIVHAIFGLSMGLASFFGGTSLIIAVQVILDVLQQTESHLMMRHYDGFMKSGKLRGRSR
jgi:preprotein translocase subunit SecY